MIGEYFSHFNDSDQDMAEDSQVVRSALHAGALAANVIHLEDR